MQHNILSDYLNTVEQAVLTITDAYIENYVEEILTPTRANLRLRIRFTNGCLLELNEAVIVQDNQLISLDYRYHYQDKQNRLIFRYDNAPHFPDLASFPHHKHLPDKTIESNKPTIFQVLKETEGLK
jgi:hypothetical protein